jgi:hypothetical protein
MARMAGNVGVILAVRLLGCARTCRMVLASLTVRLNRSNRTVCTDRGQTGTPGDTVVRQHQVGGNIPPGRSRRERDLRSEFRGTEVLEAIMAGVVVASAVSVFLWGLVMGVIGSSRLQSAARTVPTHWPAMHPTGSPGTPAGWPASAAATWMRNSSGRWASPRTSLLNSAQSELLLAAARVPSRKDSEYLVCDLGS